jgi:acyl-CoA synthetase (AMP-forming)/AMP-acid ligase II
MTPLLTMGEALTRNASLYPKKCGARDLARGMTFQEWNRRACRLANALLGLGLAKGDRVAILAYNCVEWMEIYAATAKAGLAAVPINFRLREEEIRYILEDCAARALIVQDDLLGSIGRSARTARRSPAAWSISAGARRRRGSCPMKR